MVDIYGKVALTGEPVRFVNHAGALGRWFDVYAFRVSVREERHVAVLFRDIHKTTQGGSRAERLAARAEYGAAALAAGVRASTGSRCCFSGRRFVIELANPSYQAPLAGRDMEGKRFADVMPVLGMEVWDVLKRVFDTGEPFFGEDSYIPYDNNQDGVREDHWFNIAYHPLGECEGSISGLIAVLTKVTAHVQARQELERTNQEGERVNRSLEEFAYVASHDLQEPLRMVNIYAQLLSKLSSDKEGKRKQYTGFDQEGVERMGTLIHDLLTFSRIIHTEAESARTAYLS